MEFEVIKRTPSEKRTYCLAALKIYKRLFCALGMPYSRTGISIYDYVEITLKDKFGYERGTHDRKDWLIAVASQAKLPQKQNKNKTTKKRQNAPKRQVLPTRLEASRRAALMRKIEKPYVSAWTPVAVLVLSPDKPSPLSNDFLSSFAWRRLRMEALKLHGARCQCCGISPREGAVMNVDHIRPRKTHPHLALDLDNLQVLCNPCNHGKGNWDATDWRK